MKNMTVTEMVDHVSIHIEEKLAGLTEISEEQCIFKVHNSLRMINEKAYEPELVSIGPYHRGKVGLQLMEEHKYRYLKLILDRRNERDVKRYTKAMRELEERTRRCYAEPISLTTEELVEMMLLDGCFIIELFRKVSKNDPCEPIFKLDWLSGLWCDMLLFENQLPFFVLTKLFEMTWIPTEEENIIGLAHEFFRKPLPFLADNIENIISNDIDHLLALLHKMMRPSSPETTGVGQMTERCMTRHCATELKEAGVKFKKVSTDNIFDIKFNNGLMEIPPLGIEDRTESVFRNLIAYEQYDAHNDHKYITDYVIFMDYLINSPGDVELLRRRGIIENWLGDDEVVSTMFNKLGESVCSSLGPDFYYSEIFQRVDYHWGKQRNVWMAKLWHNYFNSPWTLISVLAAALLLLLTLTQTIFSVLSYRPTK
jgi:hypothetical protein